MTTGNLDREEPDYYVGDGGPNDNNGPFDDGVNEFAIDDGEITGKPNQDFAWEWSDDDDDDDGAEEGVQEDGSYVTYTKTFYSYPNLSIGAYRFRMRITNSPTFPDRNIDRYLTLKAIRKYAANGITGDKELFNNGETHDDMEYFLRRLQAAESDYVSPIQDV